MNAARKPTRFTIYDLRFTISLLASIASLGTVATAAPLRFAGAPVELTISEVSQRTAKIQIAPLDDKGNPLAGTPSLVLVPFNTTERLRARDLDGIREVRSGDLRITVTPEPLSIAVRDASGKLVQELAFAGDADTNSISFHTDAPVFGLGEGEQQFDRRGHLYRMRNGQLSGTLATHGATIPVPFLIGADGWAMFLKRPWGQFDLRESPAKFLPTRGELTREPVELYITHDDEPADALAEFIRLTGSPVMPPKWVMGYMQSHRTLLGPDDPLRIAKTFREKDLPCDALIYLGTGYCTNGWNTGHGSLEFNTNAFDHPAEQIKELHDLNFKVILHINHAPPNLFGSSVSEASDSPIHIHNYWTRHEADFALGVDGWWPDDGDELPIPARITRHICYYEGPLKDRPNERPWNLNRNGYAGVARYGGWIWSGDVESRWATLAAHVPVGLNYSVSVTPFWGTDTGGFVPTRELTGELYVRWFQFSAFNPLFRSHGRTWHLRLPWGWNTGEPGPIESRDVTDRAELRNAEVEPICRKYLDLRYQLLPYNYTLMREACDRGLPPMRALWLHYPDDPEAVKLGTEYLWGRDMLVAPVVEKGATNRSVYLPAGDWYDWWTGQKMAGKRSVDRPVDLATLPIYVRAGAIIPLDPVRQYTSESVTEPTTLRVHPGADGAFTYYDDDGHTLAYRDASDPKAVWLHFTWNDHSRTLVIEPDSRMKNWSGMRRFRVETADGSGGTKTMEFHGQRVAMTL